MSSLFKVHDAFLGTVELAQEDNGDFRLFVGNRDIHVGMEGVDGEIISCGMHMNDGIDKSKVGDWEKVWRVYH